LTADQRLRRVFASVFPLDGEALRDDDSPRTIREWDSVAHVQLVLALEAEFGVSFSPDEIAELISVGVIRSRLAELGA
jgi:acyl carrier protein